MKSILKLAVILVVGILIYNYFLGTEAEKEQSKEIFSEVKDLGKAAWGLLKSEKDKFDEGKYDGALDKIGSLIDNLKDKAETIQDSDILDRIAQLEDQKAELERKLLPGMSIPMETHLTIRNKKPARTKKLKATGST